MAKPAHKETTTQIVPTEPRWRQPPPKPRTQLRERRFSAPWFSGLHLGAGFGTVVGGLRKIRLGLWVWPVLTLLAGLIYTALQVFGGYSFYVYDAEITGNLRVDRDAIYMASNVDEKNVFWLRPARSRASVVRLPGIASAQVQVALPNHVRITVQEREPLFIWQTDWYSVWIATDGEPMPALGDPPALTLEDLQGTAWSETGRFRQRVVSDLRALHERYPEIPTLYYGPAEGLFFVSKEGWNIYLGDGQINDKLALLESMRPQIAGRTKPARLVDLRVTGEAYIQ